MLPDEIYFYPPIIIIGALLIAAAVIYDYFRRIWAKTIADAVKEAGAVSPETAVSCEELEKKHPRITRKIKLLLKRYSSLRRYIRCVGDEMISVETEKEGKKDKKDKKDKKSKKKKEKITSKVTGKEKWYIIPVKKEETVLFHGDAEKEKAEADMPDGGATAEGEETVTVTADERSIPSYLRDGAEADGRLLIIGLVLLAAFTATIIYFLEPIYNFFVGFTEIGKK